MDSLSGPIKRNHSNFSRKLSTANGLSSKNAYDDVFAGLPKMGPSSTFSSRVEDYTEIFSTSRASSIPVLDLPDVDDTNVSTDFRNSKPDYSSIFVGFSDEHIGVSYDQLFPAPSAKIRTPSANIVPDQVSESSISMEQNQSYDAVKQFNMSYNKTNQEIKDERKVTTHVTELRAVPGFTCFIDETAPLNKTQDGKKNPPAINDVRQKMDFGPTSPVPVPKKETRGFVRSRNGSSWDGTYSNSKLFANPNANESNLKSQPSNLEKNNSLYKTSSKVASEKDDPRTDGRDCSASSSDVELDLNSSAAASVAALKSAIEKAQESIRFAKELMEKKDGTQNFSKKSSKSRSKAKDRRESIVARQRTHTEKQNIKETFEYTPVLFRTNDLNTAEKSEAKTGFFGLVNRGKHRRAVSAFEQVDQQECPKIETSGEVLVQREATAEEAEVVVESSESKEDMKIEENGFKVLRDEGKNSDILESTFVVPELGETNDTGSKEADQENCEEEKVEEDEFFETQDWDDGNDEEEVLVVEDGCLELVANEHKHEPVHEQQQQIVEEKSKEDVVIEENGEGVLANRLEEAFHWVENEIRLSEVFDSHINESKQIDENPGEIIETDARQEKEKDVENEEYERTQSEERVENDDCDKKENEEVDIVVGEREGHKSSESNENEMEVDEEESRSEKTQENEEEVLVDFSRVGDASTSEILLEEEASQQLERNESVEASPRESDADVDEKTCIIAPLQEDGISEKFSSTDSDTGESQVEQYTSELASDLANNDDVAVDDLRGSEEVVKEEIETIQIEEEIRTRKDTEEEEKERARVKEELAKKKERDRERMVVERAIREARERAFAEAREKAERANVEKVNAQIRQRFMAEARDKLEKASQKDEAKLKAERAAVERATQEARKRALEKAAALSQKSSASTSQPIPEASQDYYGSHGTNSESILRSKAKLEKQQRIMQRAAKALEEKNMRDTIALKEQAERNRLSESLDADIKRWSNGKEGNLRALLSTLQYVLGTSSGWQPVSLTDIVATSAVKKAYRKATLYVHPDKLQQRGATIQQKYICEKVFDLLKAAWNKFNAEER